MAAVTIGLGDNIRELTDEEREGIESDPELRGNNYRYVVVNTFTHAWENGNTVYGVTMLKDFLFDGASFALGLTWLNATNICAHDWMYCGGNLGVTTQREADSVFVLPQRKIAMQLGKRITGAAWISSHKRGPQYLPVPEVTHNEVPGTQPLPDDFFE